MVSSANIAKKIRKHGLCAFPNMVIGANIVTKSGKKKEKKNRHLDTVVGNVGALFMWSVCIL